jgi:hypothetical protein
MDPLIVINVEDEAEIQRLCPAEGMPVRASARHWGWAEARWCGRWQHEGVPGQRLAQSLGGTTAPESDDIEGSAVALQDAPGGPVRPAQAGLPGRPRPVPG